MISKMHQLLDILETNPDVYALFRHCPYELLRKIRVRKFTDGEFELEQGEIYQYMYIIVDGRANVYSESENGKNIFFVVVSLGT
ncbi:CRP-like cAMP-binding protein [Streptococcus gallinaceus]|uniref:cyclic nucleotide-binding domain-containing protein n=1 Tax=Streptococcus gallinaceus TaxID=165758 RepID=UPI00209D5DDB|nr:cyclic nucleotide-binding domain-containing protein [Streptococcus gallinaceus]MCP1638397.1 CRP-like cAMP-binding protein [Streptococcus gallinaceus]MCP1769516.1 CRP-like cAMP-binding protein [Streptococcus gallinaceus]